MTPPLNLRNGTDLIISPTQLGAMKSCPRQWLYDYLHRRVRAGAFAARDGGKAFDDALNRRYREAGSSVVPEHVQTRMLADIDAGFADLDLPLDEYRTAARYKEVVQAYNEHYREEPFDVLGVQVPFEVHLGDVPVSVDFWTRLNLPPCDITLAQETRVRRVHVYLHGILDLLIRQRDSGLVLIADTKTSSKWDVRSEAGYENHAQMKGYAWSIPRVAAQARARGQLTEQLALFPERVHGCLINAVVIRAPYKTERYANSAKAQPRTEFTRRVYTYSEERLEEWRADTLAQCEEALRWVASGHFRQNEAHCAHHYGGMCPYRDVCMVPKDQRAMVLASDLFTDYKSAKELEGVTADRKNDS